MKKISLFKTLGKAKAVLGLDIGTSSIKAILLKVTKEEVELANVGMVELHLDPTIENKEKRAKVIEGIKKLLEENEIKTKDVVIAVPGQSVIIRHRKLPSGARARLDQVIKFEAQNQIPFPLDKVGMDYQALPGKEGEEVKVILAAMKRELIDDHLALVEEAGLRCEVIDISSLALYNALRYKKPPKEAEVVALIDIGATTTDISIHRDGILEFTRSAPVAGNDLTEAIQTKLVVSFSEAEKLKREEGDALFKAQEKPSEVPPIPEKPPEMPPTPEKPPEIPLAPEKPPEALPPEVPSTPEKPPEVIPPEIPPTPETPPEIPPEKPPEKPPEIPPTPETPPEMPPEKPPEMPPTPEKPPEKPPEVPPALNPTTQVASALSPILENLFAEIRRSLNYYRSQSEGAKITKVILSGGGARLKNLDRFLSQRLGAPVEIADPLSRIKYDPSTFKLKEILPSFSVSVGLALRALELGEIKISLLPQIVKERALIQTRKRNLMIAAGLGVAIIVFSGLLFLQQLQQREARLEQIKAELEKIKDIVPKVEKLKKEKAAVEKRMKVITGLLTEKARWLDVLLEMTKVFPSSVWIKSLSLPAKDSASISAQASSVEAVSNLMVRLNKSPYFEEIDLGSIQTPPEGEAVSFPMKWKIKKVVKKVATLSADEAGAETAKEKAGGQVRK
ncbi:MAG TPA: type IV pilus assembly protein PilM [bacterium]|nr:type IV pilus assembly protein PilM [bacterium]